MELNKVAFPYRLTNTLVLLLIGMTPVFSMLEVFALISGSLKNQTTALTPIYIKGLKDLLEIVIFSIFLLRKPQVFILSEIIPKLVFYLLVLACIFLTLVSDSHKIGLVLAGIRWLLPVLILLAIDNEWAKQISQPIAKVLAVLVCFNFLLQVFELFFASRWFGVNSLGLSARSPGFFLIPSTSASFICIAAIYFQEFIPQKFWRNILIAISAAGLLLTASGSGLAVFTILLFFLLVKKNRAIFLMVTPLIAIALLSLLPQILGRPDDYLSQSGGTRLDLLATAFNQGEFLSSNFGFGTNTGVSLARNLGQGQDSMISDSLFVSVLVNLGYSGLLLLIIGLIFFTYKVAIARSDTILVIFAYTLVFFFSTVFTEVFPANILLAILLRRFLDGSQNISHSLFLQR